MLIRILCFLALFAGIYGPTPAWSIFQAGFHLPGPSSPAKAAITFDDGGGPRLFIGVESPVDGRRGGVFTWDGTQWTAVAGPAGGVTGLVRDLEIFDDGSGPALWAIGQLTQAGGQPASLIAKWDGVDWTVPEDMAASPTVGSAMSAGIFDDGTGPALYVGARIMNGSLQSLAVLRWTGNQWLQVGPFFTGSSIDDLLAFDGGTGAELYAAGVFTRVGGQNASSIVRWNGTEWLLLPGEPGTNGIANNFAQRLTIFDAGDGPKLYASGIFRVAGGLAAEGLAAWDGASWSVPDLGIEDIRSATTHDFGDGEVMLLALPSAPTRVAVWDRTQVSDLGNRVFETGSVSKFFSSGSGGPLVAVGHFDLAGDGPVVNTAEWTQTGWSPMTDGSPANGLNRAPAALHVFDDGTGPALYAGGSSSFAGAYSLGTLARWTGTEWEAVADLNGETLTGSVTALETYHFGGADHLIIAGSMRIAGTGSFTQLIAWDGTNWTPILQDSDGTQGSILAMEVFDDGSGPELYLGGNFRDYGPAAKMARFDGSSFVSMPGPEIVGFVRTLRSFDGQLWVGGDFISAGFVTELSGLARWNGAAWSAPPAYLIGPSFEGADVHSLEVHDAGDGDGEQLYLAGAFARSGLDDAPLFNVARWDEAAGNFAALGAGVRIPGSEDGFAQKLLSFDPGDGPSLFALGQFSDAGDVKSSKIARWRSGIWRAVGGPAGQGLNGTIGFSTSMAAFDDGVHGGGVFIGADFSTAGGVASDRFALFTLIPQVFADGFESGDTATWSITQP